MCVRVRVRVRVCVCVRACVRVGPLCTPHFITTSRSTPGSPVANGRAHLHSSAKRKLGEDKGYVFDKRLRYNVRQSDSHCRFRDIVVRKEEGFTHVLLSSQTTDSNALTPEVNKAQHSG